MRRGWRRVSQRGLVGAAATVATTIVASLVVATITGTSILGAGAAPKPQATAAPTITAGPSGLVSTTSATFSFAGVGATFRCARDGAALTTCTPAISYTSLAQGNHTFSVTATAPGKSESSATTRTWTVDTVAPPSPTISGQDASTTSTSAGFRIDEAESSATFVCSLDDAPFGSCTKNPKYSGLDYGDHCLAAKAIDAAGNPSAATTFCWVIVGKRVFGITGTFAGPFYPGVVQPVNLRFANSDNQSITVTAIDIVVAQATSKSGCNGPQNLQIERPFSGTVTVPANSVMTLSELDVPDGQWPRLTMPNLPYSQDACRNAIFDITYTGTAS